MREIEPIEVVPDRIKWETPSQSGEGALRSVGGLLVYVGASQKRGQLNQIPQLGQCGKIDPAAKALIASTAPTISIRWNLPGRPRR